MTRRRKKLYSEADYLVGILEIIRRPTQSDIITRAGRIVKRSKEYHVRMDGGIKIR
jgi:hypothetical protein